MSTEFTATARRTGTTTTYTVSVAPLKLAPFMRSASISKKVATVVRDGGTSAAKFRTKLAHGGWALRGAAKQPGEGKPDVTGDVLDEQPDAKTLFLSGGVEVLEVSVPASSGLKVGPKDRTWIFIRSPANVFFYSGHGAWWDCSLLLDVGHDLYSNWLDPEDILPEWRKQGVDVTRSPWWNLDVLIINGCSVIGDWGLSNGGSMAPCAGLAKDAFACRAPLRDPGLPRHSSAGQQRGRSDRPGDGSGYCEWSRRSMGSVRAQVGRDQREASADANGCGHRRRGLLVHQPEDRAASHTHEARPLSGFDPKKPEGAIMGPGPVPTS